MSTSTVERGTKAAPYASNFDPSTGARLAATEYERVVATFELLGPEQWSAPTDCTGWDVRAMAGHMLGMTRMASSLKETLRQQFAAKRRQKREGGLGIDALTGLQVDESASLTTAELLEQMRQLGPKAATSRFNLPKFVLGRTIDPQVGDDPREWWRLEFLLFTILTRDPFMHRIDIARATGVQLPASPDHEGLIVDDVVDEWAARHGAPVTLELTGPAGGAWHFGGDASGEHITMDAFEFCRAISGRAPASGLLAQQVPF